MLRLATQVTTSPTAWRRRSSATSATAATSGPRAENSVTISSTPTSCPASTPSSTSRTAPDDDTAAADPAHDDEAAGTSVVGRASLPEYHAVDTGPTISTSAPADGLATAS